MPTILIFLVWYYKELPQKILRVWSNYIWYWSYYFSLKDLFRTFFSPWRKYSMIYGRRFDFGKWFSSFVFNIFSRFIGMLFRLFLIIFAIVFEILTLIFGILFFLIWFFFPLLLIAIFAIGIINL